MSDIDQKIEALTAEIKAVAGEIGQKASLEADRRTYLEAEIARLDTAYTELTAEKAQKDLEDRLGLLEAKALSFGDTSNAAKAIFANGLSGDSGIKAYGEYNTETNWLKALVDRRKGDPDAVHFVKAVLGTSAATGDAIVPNNFVAQLVEQVAFGNIYRSSGLIAFLPGVQGGGVDIPYEITAIQAALLQGAFGSNKLVRDFAFGEATATLYTIAEIADIGNQLLRRSNGVAEQTARRRLAKAFAEREADYIINGSGSSQPLGILQAFMAFGDVAAYKYALNSETRVSALGNGIAKLENIGRQANGIVMNPTDFWEMSVETLGTSGSGGWAMDPTGGAVTPRVSVWGIPVFRDSHIAAGTALIGDWTDCEVYLGDEYRVDVSDQAGDRWDKNITGFRAEEEFAFNAEPYVRTGHFIKVTGV